MIFVPINLSLLIMCILLFFTRILYYSITAGELLLPELNGNVITTKLLPLPPIKYKAGDEVVDDDDDDEEDVVKPGNTWCVDFPTSGWSQFCTLWKRMVLQLYRNKVNSHYLYNNHTNIRH